MREPEYEVRLLLVIGLDKTTTIEKDLETQHSLKTTIYSFEF